MKNLTLNVLRYTGIIVLLFMLSCDKDEDPCFETVCYGPNGTDCVEEPKTGVGGCFAPAPDS